MRRKCPGSKIRSKGKGRGLGIGKGKGPIGRRRPSRHTRKVRVGKGRKYKKKILVNERIKKRKSFGSSPGRKISKWEYLRGWAKAGFPRRGPHKSYRVENFSSLDYDVDEAVKFKMKGAVVTKDLYNKQGMLYAAEGKVLSDEKAHELQRKMYARIIQPHYGLSLKKQQQANLTYQARKPWK